MTFSACPPDRSPAAGRYLKEAALEANKWCRLAGAGCGYGAANSESADQSEPAWLM